MANQARAVVSSRPPTAGPPGPHTSEQIANFWTGWRSYYPTTLRRYDERVAAESHS